MSWRSDSTALVLGAWVSSAYSGHGVRGADVPSAGTHGPALLFQHISLPTDADSEFRWVPSVVPGSGVLDLGEDSGYTLTGAADGNYALNGTWFRDGVSQGASNNTITIGAGEIIEAGVGAAAAAGMSAAIVLATTVQASAGGAAATGQTAGISIGGTVSAGIGSAAAGGLQALVSQPQTISSAVGGASAVGFAVSVQPGIVIAAAAGQSTAAGLSAAISLSTAIASQVGQAGAAGLQATVSSPSADRLYPLAGLTEYYPLAGRI